MPYFTLKDGTKLAYDDMGVGRPVIFLHGWSGERKSANSFGPFLPMLNAKGGYRAIAYDQRGSGDTTDSVTRPVEVDMLSEDLRELLVGLDLKGATILGHSMGSQVLLHYIDKYGCDEYTRAIICVDQSPCIIKKDNWDLGMYRGAYTLEEGLAEYEKMRSDWLGYYVPFMKAALPEMNSWPQEQVDAVIAQANSLFHTDETVELFPSLHYLDNRAALKKVTVPLGYFYADPGGLYKPELSDFYGSNVAGEYRAYPFAGDSHGFFVERPQEFFEKLIDFLEAT